MVRSLHTRSLHLAATLLAILSAGLTAFAAPSASIDAPANPDSLQEVRSLLDYLNSVKGSQIIAGQDVTINWDGSYGTKEIDYLQEQTGHKPVVRGFDFIFLNNPSCVDPITHEPLQKIARNALIWWQGGGLVALQWHWNLGTLPDHYSFYTTQKDSSGATIQGTDFDFTKALVAGTAQNDTFNKDIDQVASELRKLRDARIPVLWRPFHEVGGNWFWWSAQYDTATKTLVKNPALFRQFWIYLFNRLTYKHGLNNLIWVWNPTFYDKATLDQWYPGDGYVDIVSYDVYPGNGTHPEFSADYKALSAYRSGRKVVTMSENGPIPDIDACFANGAEWSYFSTWNSSFITDATKSGVTADSTSVPNNLNFLKKVYTHDKVVTLDKFSQAAAISRVRVTPSVLVPPADAAPARGARTTLSVLAQGDAPFTYQWLKDGVLIPGATQRDYTIASVAASDAGAYSVRITNAGGTLTSASARLSPGASDYTAPASVLSNVSSRAITDSSDGSKVLTAGFAISGSGAKTVLIRAVGPTLSQWGVSGLLSFPALRLYKDGDNLIAHNTNWTTAENSDAIQAAASSVGAFPLSNPYDASPTPALFGDSALLITLPAGSTYTAQAVGADAGAGVTLIEVYDVDIASSAHISNLSARGLVDSGNNAFNVGFVVSGSASKYMLIRAIGPTLKQLFGMQNAVSAVKMQLMNSKQVEVAANDGWDKDPSLGALIASASTLLSGWGPTTGAKDAAFLRTLPAELSTAVIQPNGVSAGIGMVEVYDADALNH
jgi:mannan endo-1,4-beta-mannosidase